MYDKNWRHSPNLTMTPFKLAGSMQWIYLHQILKRRKKKNKCLTKFIFVVLKAWAIPWFLITKRLSINSGRKWVMYAKGEWLPRLYTSLIGGERSLWIFCFWNFTKRTQGVNGQGLLRCAAQTEVNDWRNGFPLSLSLRLNNAKALWM